METQDDWPNFPMMSVADAAERLGHKPETLYRAIRRSLADGGLPIGYQSGGVWLIYTSAARHFRPLESGGQPKKRRRTTK